MFKLVQPHLTRKPTSGHHFMTTSVHPATNRLSGRHFGTGPAPAKVKVKKVPKVNTKKTFDPNLSRALVAVKAKPVPKTYTEKTFDKADPATGQLIIENHERLEQDLKNFMDRPLTRVTGTLRKRKVQHWIDRATMEHVLGRHSLRHFAGKFKKKQTFFPENITIPRISALMTLVYRTGRRMQRRKPKPGQVVDKTFFQRTARVNGVGYVLGMRGSRVVQFYPRKDSVDVPGPTGQLLTKLKTNRKPVLVIKREAE